MLQLLLAPHALCATASALQRCTLLHVPASKFLAVECPDVARDFSSAAASCPNVPCCCFPASFHQALCPAAPPLHHDSQMLCRSSRRGASTSSSPTSTSPRWTLPRTTSSWSSRTACSPCPSWSRVRCTGRVWQQQFRSNQDIRGVQMGRLVRSRLGI